MNKTLVSQFEIIYILQEGKGVLYTKTNYFSSALNSTQDNYKT